MFSEVNDEHRSSRAQDEVSRQILADESLWRKGNNAPTPLKFDLHPGESRSIYGPNSDSENASRTTGQNEDRQYSIHPLKFTGPATSPQEFKDSITDKVFTGFGHFQSKADHWRFDYIDPSNCNTKAKIGICFKLTR